MPRLTCVKSLQLIARHLRIVHAFEEGSDASIFFAPEIVRNCRSQRCSCAQACDNEHERDTEGCSDTVPGIAPEIERERCPMLSGKMAISDNVLGDNCCVVWTCSSLGNEGQE